MSRPHTLAEAADRIAAGAPWEIAIPEFLDTFYEAETPDKKLASIQKEPQVSPNDKLNALYGATAEYLAKQHRLKSVPSWVSAPERILKEPWFTTTSDAPGMKEYLTWASPAEFRHHLIFTEAVPFRRAKTPQPDPTANFLKETRGKLGATHKLF